ncbi:MAG: hypothetical protein V1914_04980 [archaeon]
MGLKDLVLFYYPLFRRTLFETEKAYTLKRDQSDGEKDLIEICKTAKREYHWTYFKNTNLWLHSKCNHKEIFNPETGDVQMAVDYLPISTDTALGNELVEYHLHPDYFVDYYLQVNPKQQIVPNELFKHYLIYPSKADLINSFEDSDREYKLATSLGITTYQLHSKELFEQNKPLSKLLIGPHKLDITNITNFQNCLQTSVEKVNKTMQGHATIKFCPKDKI